MSSFKSPLYDSDKKYIKPAHLILTSILACTDRGTVLAPINLLFNVSKTKISSALNESYLLYFHLCWLPHLIILGLLTCSCSRHLIFTKLLVLTWVIPGFHQAKDFHSPRPHFHSAPSGHRASPESLASWTKEKIRTKEMRKMTKTSPGYPPLLLRQASHPVQVHHLLHLRS